MQLLEDIDSSMTRCDVELLAVAVCSVVLTSALDHPPECESNSQEQLSLVTICNRLRLGDAASVWVNGVDSMRNCYDTSLRAGA